MINTGTATFRQDLLGPILQEGFPEDVYVSHKVLPTILVQKKDGAVPSFLFSNDQALSIKRAPKTSYARIVSKLGQSNYTCTEAGVEEFLSPEDYEIMGKDYAEMLISRRLVHTVLRSRDIALSTALFSAGGETIFAQNLVTVGGGLEWDTSNGLPLTDVLQAKLNIAKATGVPGNAMILSYDLYIILCKNPQIQTLVRNVMGYGGGAFTNDAIMNEIPVKVLAQVFGLEEIIVAMGIVDTTNESTVGNTGVTATRSFIWSNDYALVFRKSGGAQDMREVAMGRMFIYDLAYGIGSLATGSMDSMRALMLETYRREDVNADAFRCREYIDMQILLASAGALIKNTHS